MIDFENMLPSPYSVICAMIQKVAVSKAKKLSYEEDGLTITVYACGDVIRCDIKPDSKVLNKF